MTFGNSFMSNVRIQDLSLIPSNEIDALVSCDEESVVSNEKALNLLAYVLTLTCSFQVMIATKRTRSQTQVAMMSFLCRVAGLSLRNEVRSSIIHRELGLELVSSV